jgi:YesN/AraC family two-component response regulator
MEKIYKILIVDDEEQVAKIIAKYLSFYKGFASHIVIASDGVQAMQKLSNQEFDLVITDLVMPKRDGFTLIDHIRKIPKYYKLKFMIISGCLNRDLCMIAMRKGIRQIIVKPFSARQVLEKAFEVLKVDERPQEAVSKILQKAAQHVAFEMERAGDSFSEKDISELIAAYKNLKN